MMNSADRSVNEGEPIIAGGPGRIELANFLIETVVLHYDNEDAVEVTDIIPIVGKRAYGVGCRNDSHKSSVLRELGKKRSHFLPPDS
jgi:hypothetical protein